MKKLKKIPDFRSEDDEREFWATHDVIDYFDFKHPLQGDFINLRPSTKSITVRLPEWLIDDLKMIANKKDVPYQSLLKIYLAQKVQEEHRAQVARRG